MVVLGFSTNSPDVIQRIDMYVMGTNRRSAGQYKSGMLVAV